MINIPIGELKRKVDAQCAADEIEEIALKILKENHVLADIVNISTRHMERGTKQAVEEGYIGIMLYQQFSLLLALLVKDKLIKITKQKNV